MTYHIEGIDISDVLMWVVRDWNGGVGPGICVCFTQAVHTGCGRHGDGCYIWDI